MKKVIYFIIFLSTAISLSSQEIVKTKLTNLGVKKYIIENNPTKNIQSIYTFNENSTKGGIILFNLTEIKLDVFATIIQTATDYTVTSLEPINSNAYNTKMMGQLLQSFSRWKNIKEKSIIDVVSSATKHSRGIYLQIQKALVDGIVILKTQK